MRQALRPMVLAALMLAIGAALLAARGPGSGEIDAADISGEPDSAVTFPLPDATVTSPVTFAGTAVDDTGVDRVQVAVRDIDSGLWLRTDGSFGGFQLHLTTFVSPGQTSGTWSHTLSLPDGNYGLSVRATDIDEITETSRPWVLFSVDNSSVPAPPSVAIAAPADGSTVSAPVTISGTTDDDQSVTAVDLTIRNRSGSWVDATGATTTAYTPIATTLAVPGAADTTWSTAVALDPGEYRITATATDDHGRRSSPASSVGITVDDGVAPDPVTFRAIGDVPYDPPDVDFDTQIPLLPATDEFLIHLGDIKRGAPACVASIYQAVSGTLLSSPRPVFVIPGDNEWNDCSDPVQGWANWLTYLSRFDENFTHPYTVVHQPVRDENFAFVDEDVVFIGINLVGGKILNQADWDARIAEDAAWIDQQLDANESTVTSAVIFGHAFPEDAFRDAVRDFAKPVLYIQGDLHIWLTGNPWAGDVDNLTWAVVPQGMPGVRVTVTHNPTAPFAFDLTP